jgi:E3 ubiquitin-protein ligase HUWE1
MCREFIAQGGLELILSATDLPCIPIRFLDTQDAAHALSHLFRTISEQDHLQLVSKLIASLASAMEGCSRLWRNPLAHDNWLALDKGEADEGLRADLRTLRAVGTRLAYLSESLIGLPWSHSRPATALIKALGVSSGSNFIPDLGLLHRACFQEHVALKSSIPPPSPVSTAPSTIIGTEEADMPSAPSSEAVPKESGARLMARRMHAILAKFFKCR